MDKTKKRRIQILAASVFWLGVWQAAAVAIGQEVFLVSPVQAIGTLVELLPPEGEELEIIARQIANAHTLFNALCTLIWLPLTPLMVRLVTTLVPEKRTE